MIDCTQYFHGLLINALSGKQSLSQLSDATSSIDQVIANRYKEVLMEHYNGPYLVSDTAAIRMRYTRPRMVLFELAMLRGDAWSIVC